MTGPKLSTDTTRSVEGRVAANIGLLISGKLAAGVLGMVSIFLAIHALTPVEFGTLVFIHAYMLFFADVATFQSWQSIIRFGSEDIQQNRPDRLANLLNFSVRLDVLSVIFAYTLSLLFMGAVVWFFKTYPRFSTTEFVDVERLQVYTALYCLVVLVRQTGTATGVLRLFDRFQVLAAQTIVQPVVRLIGVMLALIFDGGFEAFLLAWFAGSLASYVALIYRGFRELNNRDLIIPTLKAKYNLWNFREGLWPFVIKSNIDSTIATGTRNLPILMVTGFFGVTWAGVYKLAEEVSKLLSEGFKLLDQVIYPELAKLVASGQSERIWRLVMHAALVMVSVGLILSAIIIVTGSDVLSYVFGPEYEKAAPLASLLVPAAALIGIAAPLYPVFYAAGKPERALIIRGVVLAAYIGFFISFSRLVGPMAPGWAALASNIVAVVIIVIAARSTLKSPITVNAKARYASGVDVEEDDDD